MSDVTTPDTATEYRWIGKQVARKEDPKLITGRATYVGDVAIPGMLHGAVLTSPHAHARIVSIDTSRAKALPGVVAVLTGADAAELVGPMTAFCAEPVEQRAIAVDKVRYWGEAVVAVAATSRYVAEDAVALVDVEYEVLDPVVDMHEAMEPTAARLHDTLDSNVVFHSDRSYGDVEGDFARAEHVVRASARWHRMAAQPIETAGAVCSWDPFESSMTIWSNSSFYNFLPWSFASMLGVATNRMRMIPCAVGGSFGSKHLLNKVLCIAGALTKATGRPVRYLEDRLENIAANDNVGCDRYYDAELALTADGEMLGLKLHCVDDYGAYFQFGPGQHGCAMAQPVGPYRIGSLQYEVSAVLTNKVQQGFFRGAGADPGNFILERLVDAAAEQLGMDRAEIRRRNFIQPDQFPYRIPSGNIYDSGDYEGVLDKALELAGLDHWRAEQQRLREEEGRYIGIGLATCQERTAYNATEWWFLYDEPPLPASSTPETVKIDIDAFGGIRIELGCPVWGNSPQTVAAQIVAEEFGVDPADITVELGDSTSGMISAGPGGSRLTVMLSGAAKGAATVLRDKMARIAAHQMEIDPGDLELTDGVFRPRGEPSHDGMALADVAMLAHLFKQSNPDEDSSGLVATFTYDHPFASMPSEDRSDTGAFYPIDDQLLGNVTIPTDHEGVLESL